MPPPCWKLLVIMLAGMRLGQPRACGLPRPSRGCGSFPSGQTANGCVHVLGTLAAVWQLPETIQRFPTCRCIHFERAAPPGGAAAGRMTRQWPHAPAPTRLARPSSRRCKVGRIGHVGPFQRAAVQSSRTGCPPAFILRPAGLREQRSKRTRSSGPALQPEAWQRGIMTGKPICECSGATEGARARLRRTPARVHSPRSQALAPAPPHLCQMSISMST